MCSLILKATAICLDDVLFIEIALFSKKRHDCGKPPDWGGLLEFQCPKSIARYYCLPLVGIQIE